MHGRRSYPPPRSGSKPPLSPPSHRLGVFEVRLLAGQERQSRSPALGDAGGVGLQDPLTGSAGADGADDLVDGGGQPLGVILGDKVPAASDRHRAADRLAQTRITTWVTHPAANRRPPSAGRQRTACTA